MESLSVLICLNSPVFVLANVLLITSAPALTLAQVRGLCCFSLSITDSEFRVQITQAASGDAFERLISRTIFWAYCVVTPVSAIISVVIGLLLVET